MGWYLENKEIPYKIISDCQRGESNAVSWLYRMDKAPTKLYKLQAWSKSGILGSQGLHELLLWLPINSQQAMYRGTE